MEAKKQVAPTLREMRVGEREEYPIKMLNTVRVTIQRLRLMEGKHYGTSTGQGMVIVTRTA